MSSMSIFNKKFGIVVMMILSVMLVLSIVHQPVAAERLLLEPEEYSDGRTNGVQPGGLASRWLANFHPVRVHTWSCQWWSHPSTMFSILTSKTFITLVVWVLGSSWKTCTLVFDLNQGSLIILLNNPWKFSYQANMLYVYFDS